MCFLYECVCLSAKVAHFKKTRMSLKKKLIYKRKLWPCVCISTLLTSGLAIICLLRRQTANRTWWEETKRKVDANSVDESGDVVFGGGMQGSDMDVREWCGREIFQHTFSSLPLIGVPPRWE